MGLVCMDRNSKDFYVKDMDQNVADTEAFIASTRSMIVSSLSFQYLRNPR